MGWRGRGCWLDGDGGGGGGFRGGGLVNTYEGLIVGVAMASVVDLGIVVDGYSVITYTLENSVVICQFVLDIFLHHGFPVATVHLVHQAGKHNGRIWTQFGGTCSDSTPKRQECSSGINRVPSLTEDGVPRHNGGRGEFSGYQTMTLG
jgi:hypothetical protein